MENKVNGTTLENVLDKIEEIIDKVQSSIEILGEAQNTLATTFVEMKKMKQK